ncbi:MAG: O-antigen ligase family protein [Burkholderiaceae bacterium]
MQVFQRLMRVWHHWRSGLDGASTPALVGMCAGAVAIGWLSVMVSGLASTKPVLLAVLPVMLLTGFLFIYSREAFLLVVLLVRAGSNPLFEETRLPGIGGLGGLLNALIIVLAALIIMRDPKRVPRAALWIWLPFALMAGVGLVYSPDRIQAIRLYLGLVSVVALFLVAFYLVMEEADLNKMLKLVTWSSVPVALVTLIYIALGRTAGIVDGFEDAGSRYGGPFPHANILAFYLVLSLGVIFYRWKSKLTPQGPFHTATLVSYMFLLLGLLIATKTRSAWISVLLLFVVYGVFRERRYLVYLGVGGFVAMAALPEFRERVVGLGQGNEVVQYAKLNSFAWRKLLWEDALTWMSPTRYLMGYGSESFATNSPTFFSMAGRTNWGAHSAAVQVFFELGAIGLAAFFWIYYRTARMIAALWRKRPLLALIGLTLLAANFLVSLSDNMLSYLIYNWYFWFTMGCICALAVRIAGAGERAKRRPWGIKPSRQWAQTEPAMLEPRQPVRPARQPAVFRPASARMRTSPDPIRGRLG